MDSRSSEPAEGSLTAERPARPRAPSRKPSAASQNATPLGTGPGPRPGASLAGGAVRGRRGARERGPGAGAGSSGQEDPTLPRGRDRGVEGGGAHASPAPDPLGEARRKSEAPPETEPTPTRHDPGRENRIEVPPRAGTTPERPAVLGWQGGLDEEEPGPAREPRLHPTRAGGWASPSRLARLGPPALSPAGGRPACRWGRDPPSLPGTLARPGPRVLKTRAAPPGPPGGTGGGGAARAPSRSGNTPRPRGGEAPGPSAWKRSWNRGG
ncbi:hypothetical protein NDU88_006798 [Pleurodeles waltl]|uniref:Uncharacterized protein n=1 Tax=Pleurodeles waltl TaxID=8319 RepID=A0AAV7PNF8_PLEWA|nr:hypothetical protein NDU88_006798 [Pleurodeles waltl]